MRSRLSLCENKVDLYTISNDDKMTLKRRAFKKGQGHSLSSLSPTYI